MIQNGVSYQFIKDHLGSVRLVVNAATGEIEQRMDYDEFGVVLADTNPGFQPFGFAGGVYDADTKLVRFGARDYDAETGRWLEKDPMKLRGNDINFYAYALNDPINNHDADGKFAAIPIAIGAIALAIVIHDIYKYIQGEPTLCGKAVNYVRNQVSPEIRQFFNIPEPDPSY